MSKRSLASLAAVTVIALAATSVARAQSCSNAGPSTATCSVVATATATVADVVSMNIGTTSLALSGVDSAPQFNGSGIYQPANNGLHTITVRANRSWTLSVKADAANWTDTPAGTAGSYSKPAGDLAWAIGASPSSYTPMTTSNATVSTGSATNSQAVAMNYQTTYDITKDLPGTYTLGLTFTISAP